MWMKNVRKYYKENILNDGWSDHGWAFWVDVIYPYGLLRKGEACDALATLSRVETSRSAAYHRRAWSTFIRQMLLSDVNIINPGEYGTGVEDVAPFAHTTDIVLNRLKLVVWFHDRLSSEIKDEICSKLASALRALKSRISRICGIT